MNQLNMFGDVTQPSTSVIGLIVTLPSACMRGNRDAHRIIGWSAFRIVTVQGLRQAPWLGECHHLSILTDVVDRFGRPAEPISVQFKNSRVSADDYPL